VTTLPPTTIPDSYTGRCAEGLYPASYAPDAPCVTTDPCPSLAARQRGTWDDPAITEDKRIPYQDPLVRKIAEALHRNESMHMHWYISSVVCPYCALRASVAVRMVRS